MIRSLMRPAPWMVVLLIHGLRPPQVKATMMSGELRSRTLQVGPQPPTPDSTDVLAAARYVQARFERLRRNTLPWTSGEPSRPCDNRVGRFCHWFDRDSSWEPVADSPDLVRLREALLTELAEAQARSPGDTWILGQRVFYMAEAGQWREAAELAGACGLEPSWWCGVLGGFALHGAGEYEAAMSAFQRGLAGMDPEEARKWRHPDVILDGKARDLMNDADEVEFEALRARFWLLADPLYLMAGNDRETEHYSRWTYSLMSDRARSPRRLPWGSDLEELTLRYGWDRGWEKRRPRAGSLSQEGGTVGHRWPEIREFVPPGVVLEGPWRTAPGTWLPTERARAAHAAVYSPDLDPGVGQVAVFHRGDSMLVAAATRLPELSDSSAARSVSGAIPSIEPAGPLPWAQPPLLDEPDQIGLFLIDPENRIHEARRLGGSEGVAALSVPAGRYLMSLEAWAPAEGRGGRVRHGVVTDTVPEDLATLSDLVVLDSTDPLPQRLREALPLMRSSLELIAGQRFAVGWEILGLGWRPERVDFQLSLFEEGGSFFGKVGGWLGLGGGDEPLRIGWSEPTPDQTGPWFRSVNVDMPELEPGEYILRLEVTFRGREPLVGTRIVQVSSEGSKVAQSQDVRR